VAVGTGNSPVFFGSSSMLREERLSTIWIMGSDFLDATATVFFVRLPLPFRAAGRAVISLDRIQTPPEFWLDRLYGSDDLTVNVGILIPLLLDPSLV
jgi:hypothetical protein